MLSANSEGCLGSIPMYVPRLVSTHLLQTTVIARSYPNMSGNQRQSSRLIDGSYWVNTETAAQMCGVAKTTIIAWRKQPNAPPYDTKMKMYNAVKLGEWIREEQIYKMGKGGTHPWQPDLTRYPKLAHQLEAVSAPVTMLPGMTVPETEIKEDYETRIKRLKGDELQMKLNERAGELVNADEVLIALSSMVSRVKTRILSLPTSLAATVTGKTDRVEVQSIIEDKIHATLEELSTDPMKDIVNQDE